MEVWRHVIKNQDLSSVDIMLVGDPKHICITSRMRSSTNILPDVDIRQKKAFDTLSSDLARRGLRANSSYSDSSRSCDYTMAES